MLDLHLVVLAACLARARAGKSIAARMAITTNSSISVKAEPVFDRFHVFFIIFFMAPAPDFARKVVLSKRKNHTPGQRESQLMTAVSCQMREGSITRRNGPHPLGGVGRPGADGFLHRIEGDVIVEK